MSELKTVYVKIAEARKWIKEHPEKKAGYNPFSKFSYYTPEQIDNIVYKACNKSGILPLFELTGTKEQMTGRLKIVDLDTGEWVNIEMVSGIPEIKATNITQQLGGAMTYTHRYLLMSTFGITENSLDPDSLKPEEKKNSLKQFDELRKQLESLTTIVDLRSLYAHVKELKENADAKEQGLADRLMKDIIAKVDTLKLQETI